jgi:hypothetical protein
MDPLISYEDFKTDIMEACQFIIGDLGFSLKELHQGCYELRGEKCSFMFSFDRGEIFCKLLIPNHSVAKSGYNIYSVLLLLCPGLDSCLFEKRVLNYRRQLFQYSSLIILFLNDIINGDLSWVSRYSEKEEALNLKIKYVLQKLDFNSVIYQKLRSGDKSWEQDLDTFLKINKVHLNDLLE